MTPYIEWRDCIGNPYLVRLRSEMLSPQGAVVTRNIKTPKKRSHEDFCQLVDVHYDQKYVISKIKHLIIEPLALQPDRYNEFIALVAAAWREYQAELKQKDSRNPYTNH